MVEIQDQGECGSCYAFSTAAMLAERLCTNEKTENSSEDDSTSATLLSAEYIISCDALDFGCQGANLLSTMDFLEN